MIQDRKKKDFHKINNMVSKVMLLIFINGEYDLQILHTASLVGQG